LSKNHERRQQNWRLAGSVHSIKLSESLLF
jgi:hypothetical protein